MGRALQHDSILRQWGGLRALTPPVARLSAFGASALALVAACSACSSPKGSTSARSTSASTAKSTSSTAPATSTTKGPTTTTTLRVQPTTPGIQVQIYPTGVQFTLENHFSDLSSLVTAEHFLSPTEFAFFLSGVTLPPGGGGNTTSSTGDVKTVVVVGASSGTSVTVLLRDPESKYQVAVGSGTGFQITFS